MVLNYERKAVSDGVLICDLKDLLMWYLYRIDCTTIIIITVKQLNYDDRFCKLFGSKEESEVAGFFVFSQ